MRSHYDIAGRRPNTNMRYVGRGHAVLVIISAISIAIVISIGKYINYDVDDLQRDCVDTAGFGLGTSAHIILHLRVNLFNLLHCHHVHHVLTCFANRQLVLYLLFGT